MVDGDSESESDDDSEDDPEVSDESEYTTGSGLLDEFEAKYGEVLIAFEAGSEVVVLMDLRFFEAQSARA